MTVAYKTKLIMLNYCTEFTNFSDVDRNGDNSRIHIF